MCNKLNVHSRYTLQKEFETTGLMVQICRDKTQ